MELACPPSPRLLRASASFFGLGGSILGEQNLRLLSSARPREGHPATPASRGPRCGDPAHSASLRAFTPVFHDARERAYGLWIPAFAGMNGVAAARPTSSLRRTRLRAFAHPTACPCS